MPESFSLDVVLRLRQHREDTEERALAALHTQCHQTEATLLRVRQEMLYWTEQCARASGSLGSGASQHASYARLQFLRETEQHLQQQLMDLRRQAAEHQCAFLEARHARETLTELRSAQQNALTAQAERREQRRIEDLWLGRWTRSPR